MDQDILLTCEHAGNQVPEAYRKWFAGHERVLQSHRGYDKGALQIAGYFKKLFSAPLRHCDVTRLLVDTNRSLGHRDLFSSFAHQASDWEKQEILGKYYHPFREATLQDIEKKLAEGRSVCHLSIHTFTPVRKGQVRRAAIGLLYDPGRPWERSICNIWKSRLQCRLPQMVTRSNYPYKGVADGHTTALRKRFDPSRYVGIELEVNQKLWRYSADVLEDCLRALTETLRESLADQASLQPTLARPVD